MNIGKLVLSPPASSIREQISALAAPLLFNFYKRFILNKINAVQVQVPANVYQGRQLMMAQALGSLPPVGDPDGAPLFQPDPALAVTGMFGRKPVDGRHRALPCSCHLSNK